VAFPTLERECLGHILPATISSVRLYPLRRRPGVTHLTELPKWVDAEILYFRRSGGGNKILAVIAGGTSQLRRPGLGVLSACPERGAATSATSSK
jgi:hypothetical protein